MSKRDHKSRFLVFLFFTALCIKNIRSCGATPYPEDGTYDNNFAGNVNQMQKVIEAMIGLGDFGGWANVMYGMDSDFLPMSATFLVPSDEALSKLPMQMEFTSAIVKYHIVPHQLSYFDLHRYDEGMRLPTLLRNATILVTSNNQANFTLDDALITHPDIYVDGSFVVHGVGSLLNFTRYGTENLTDQPMVPYGSAPPLPATAGAPEADPDIEALTPLPETTSSSLLPSGRARRSDAPCLCQEFPVALTVVSVVCVIRCLRLPLR